METKILNEKLAAAVGVVPTHADVLSVRQHSLDDLTKRTKSILGMIAAATKIGIDRSDWVESDDRTLIRLTMRAHAVLHHASGFLRLSTGILPMESLFDREPERPTAIRMVEEMTRRLELRQHIGLNESVRFERLWSIKAAAATREGKLVAPVLCRVIGAYRHFVGDLPVWGAASIAVKLAGDGKLDSLEWRVRENTGEVVGKPQILRPEQAARQISLQLQTMMGQSKINLDEAAMPEWVRFGYLNLPARQAQPVLAPVYVAAISIDHQQEAQAYLIAVSATDKPFLSLNAPGARPPISRARRATFRSPLAPSPSAAEGYADESTGAER